MMESLNFIASQVMVKTAKKRKKKEEEREKKRKTKNEEGKRLGVQG